MLYTALNSANIYTYEENTKKIQKSVETPSYGSSLDLPILTNLHGFGENTTFEDTDLILLLKVYAVLLWW